jgi:hypothetical protein
MQTNSVPLPPRVASLLLQCSREMQRAANGVSSLLRSWTRPERASRREYLETSPEQRRKLPAPKSLTLNGSLPTAEASRKRLSRVLQTSSKQPAILPARNQATISLRRHTSHRGCHAQHRVNVAEVIPSEVQSQGRFQVLQLLRKGVRQARGTAQLHPHRQILPLDVRRGN